MEMGVNLSVPFTTAARLSGGFSLCLCPLSFEAGSLQVENVHGQCGMVRDHTHMDTLSESQAGAPVLNCKLSPAAAAPPLSVSSAFHHSSCGPLSPAHVYICFSFYYFPLPSLPSHFEVRILGS